MLTAKQAAATVRLCVKTMQRYHFAEPRSPQDRDLMVAEIQLHAAWIASLDPAIQHGIHDCVESELVAVCGTEVGGRLAAEFAEVLASAGIT